MTYLGRPALFFSYEIVFSLCYISMLLCMSQNESGICIRHSTLPLFNNILSYSSQCSRVLTLAFSCHPFQCVLFVLICFECSGNSIGVPRDTMIIANWFTVFFSTIGIWKMMKARDNLCRIVDTNIANPNVRKNVNLDRASRGKFIRKSAIVHVWYVLEWLSC